MFIFLLAKVVNIQLKLSPCGSQCYFFELIKNYINVIFMKQNIFFSPQIMYLFSCYVMAVLRVFYDLLETLKDLNESFPNAFFQVETSLVCSSRNTRPTSLFQTQHASLQPIIIATLVHLAHPCRNTRPSSPSQPQYSSFQPILSATLVQSPSQSQRTAPHCSQWRRRRPS